MRTGERNRYQNAMTVSNIGLASVVSDPFGKTAQSVMNEVLSTLMAFLFEDLFYLPNHVQQLFQEDLQSLFSLISFLNVMSLLPVVLVLFLILLIQFQIFYDCIFCFKFSFQLSDSFILFHCHHILQTGKIIP